MKKVTPISSKEQIGSFIRRWGNITFSIILFLVTISIYIFSNTQKEIKYISYLIANRDILPLEQVKSKDVSLYSFPENSQPPRGIKESDASKVIGQKTLITIRKGDLLSPSFFGVQDVGKGNNIAAVIPIGMRIEYLNVSDFHTLPPDLQKQNRVDIYSIPESDDDKSKKAFKILSSVEVFDLIRGKTDNGDGIVLIGFLFTDAQVQEVTSYLTSDWKLQVVLKPQDERVETIEQDEKPATKSAETE